MTVHELALRLLDGPVQRASYVTRYSSHPVIRKENVAEHSFYVALYSLIIADFLGEDCDYTRLLRRALVHDLDECETGDFVRTFKYSSPTLTAALESAACQFMEHVVEGYGKYFKVNAIAEWKRTKDDSYEGHIIRVADFIAVASYVLGEYKLGNSNIRTVMFDVTYYGENVIARLHEENSLVRLRVLVQAIVSLFKTTIREDRYDPQSYVDRCATGSGSPSFGYMASQQDDRRG